MSTVFARGEISLLLRLGSISATITRRLSRHIGRRVVQGAQHLPTQNFMEQQPDYSAWSSEKLVERVTILEKQLREQMVRLFPLVTLRWNAPI